MKAPIPLLLCMLLSACGAGSGEGLDATGRPLEESPPDPPPVDDNTIKPTLASIQTHVFTPICSVCHGGANPAAGQDLSTVEKSAVALINVDSSNPEFKRVLPGSPNESYLYLKVAGDGRAGAQMPLGGPALDDEAIAAIKQWIADGAQVPGNIAVQTQITRAVVNYDRLEGESRQLSLSFWFNRPMDFAGLNKGQVELTAYSDNASWQLTSNQLELVSTADNLLSLSISGISLDIKRLRVGLNKPAISSIISINGHLLDGDSDNIAGGEFTYDHQF